MKTCSKCAQEKPLSEFPPHKKTKDGLQSSCRPCCAAASRAYYAKNREKCREKNRKWVAKNSDYERERQAKYRIANPEIVKAAQAAWMKRNLLRMRLHGAKRRAKTRVSLSEGLVDRLFELQKGRCTCCGMPLEDKFHIDHIVPLARGGKHEDKNIQLLRAKCNMQKKDRDPIKFMQARGFLI